MFSAAIQSLLNNSGKQAAMTRAAQLNRYVNRRNNKNVTASAETNVIDSNSQLSKDLKAIQALQSFQNLQNMQSLLHPY